MTEDAITENKDDVSGTEKTKPDEKPTDEKTVVDERADFVEGLAEKAQAIEMGEEAPEPEPPEDKPKAPEDKKEPEKEPEPPEETVELVVDGEKMTVPVSKVHDAGVRALQKESAADRRLEEATRLLKEAKEQKPDIKPAPPDEDEPKPPDKGEIEEKRLAYINALQYGSSEDAAKAMEEYESVLRVPPATEQKPAPAVTKEEIIREIKMDEIFSKFQQPVDKGGFADLLDDEFGTTTAPKSGGGTMEVPTMQLFIMQEVDKLLNDGSPNDWATYQKAGETVRARFLGNRDKKPGDDFKKKGALKKAATDTITPAGGRPGGELDYSDDVEKSEEEANKEAIRDIQRSRGQL